MATVTTTAAVAAAAATKVIKRGGATTVSFKKLLSRSPSTITHLHSPLIIRNTTPSPFYLKYRTFPSFCTATNANVNTEDPPTASSPSPSESSDGGGEEKKESVNIRDVANMLDIRVGKIIKAWRHEEADSLYVEEVDVGEAEPRVICSGLVKYIPLEYLQDRNVVVLANLKPRNMRGVKSNGMLMAASDAPHENVELLEPPEGAVPGERIWFGTEEDKENQPDPASPNQIQKKKIWEQVQPHLKTDDSCTAMLGGEHLMKTSAGVVASQSLKNANIS